MQSATEFSNVTYDSATVGKEGTFQGLWGGGSVPAWHLQQIPTVFTWQPTTGSNTETLTGTLELLCE